MEWLTTGGEVYHHPCKTWTRSIDGGKCQHCEAAIPDSTLRIAREHTREQERIARQRDVQRSLKSVTQRFAQIQARADARPARTIDDADGSAKKR